MTQEQELAVEAKAESFGYHKTDKQVYETTPWMERGIFTKGANSVISNPTDFGLVTLETMFEFCQWVSDEDEYYYLNGSWRKSADPQDKPIYLTTPELFQIFKTK